MLRSIPLLLFLPAAAFGQTPEVVAKVDARLDAERAAQRTEDVEILRRLLNKACGLPDRVDRQIYKLDPTATGSNRGRLVPDPATRPPAVGPFDGVYLPGAGVVFTLHVPAGAPTAAHGERLGLSSSCSTCHEKGHAAPHTPPAAMANCYACHTEVPKGEPPLSDWDRARMDVRGEKPKPAEKPNTDRPPAEVCEPGNLQTLIAGVLAANAKNLRHLGERERITVVVTFDEVPAAKVTTADSQGLGGITKDDMKALSLGDLHLKQGKAKEAVEAYAAALGRFTAREYRLGELPELTAKEREQFADRLQTTVREGMKSYAKALLLADEPEKAKWALELATGFTVLEVTPTTVPASSAGPAKLILTLGKADLDTAKDAAAVRKAVKAERQNFPTARAK